MEFELVVDSHVSIWRRTHCIVEAETLKEAVTKASEFDYKDCINSEFLYETEEILEPEYESTIEVFDDKIETCLFRN